MQQGNRQQGRHKAYGGGFNPPPFMSAIAEMHTTNFLNQRGGLKPSSSSTLASGLSSLRVP